MENAAVAAGDAPLLPDMKALGAVHECSSCHKGFGIMRKKHHCKFCGEIFCDKCSKKRALLPEHFNEHHPRRVCDPCFEELLPLQEELIATSSMAAIDVAEQISTDSKLKRHFKSMIQDDVRRAVNMLGKFKKKGADGIPPAVLRRARGLAFLTVVKAGFIFSGRVGTGIVISRLEDGGFSAPSAIGTLGLGAGMQIGGELTEVVIVLNTEAAVEAFASNNQVSLGAKVGVSVGPVGAHATGEVYAGEGGIAAVTPAYTYSLSKGAFAGVSMEGAVVTTREHANLKFYGTKVPVADLLSGAVARPRGARPLYDALEECGAGRARKKDMKGAHNRGGCWARFMSCVTCGWY